MSKNESILVDMLWYAVDIINFFMFCMVFKSVKQI